MSAAWTIATREFRSFFRVPLGWVAMALYLLIAGLVFGRGVLVPGSPATMRDFFGLSGFLLLPIVPAITMKLLSEEAKQGTIEPLMTAPVGDLSIILGKFMGAAMFLLTVLAPTLLHVALLWMFSQPRMDLGPVLAGYLSLGLLGSVYLALGLLVSSLTANQTLAYLVTFIGLLALLLVGTEIVELPAGLAGLASRLAIRPRLADFAKGVVDLSHVVFFLSATCWFLVLAYVALASRRWR